MARMSEQVSSAAVTMGLSHDEAQARLKREGYNELPRSGRRTAFRIILEVMREPMLALLAGGAVYQGAFAFVMVAAPEAEGRAFAFFSLVAAIVALIFVNRSFSATLFTAFVRPNSALKFACPAWS